MAIAENIPRSSRGATVPANASDSIAKSSEWQLARRVVASPAFVRSALLTNFLLYVCDRKLRGREDEITEHQIGVHALGRPDNYHPGEDNVVRNYARILRKRLQEFFDEEGRHEEIRIVIPRGQYVPIFEAIERLQPVEEPRSGLGVVSESLPTPCIPETPVQAPAAFTRRRFVIAASTVAGLSGLGWFGLHGGAVSAPARHFRTFWTQIFNPRRDSFVVTGDSALVLLQRETGQDISLNKYVNGTLASDLRELSISSPATMGYLDEGRLPHYTSTADLNIAIALDRLAISMGATPKVRNARDMRMEEVKSSNGIFIGGPTANPWVKLYEPRSDFQMKFYPGGGPERTNEKSIWNKRPRQGEQQEYLNSSTLSPFTTYTVVSFLPNIDDEGWVLLLQGQILSGTGAAGDFVTNVNAIAPVLQKAQKSDGSIGTFEVVLETQAVGSDAAKARIVVERYEQMKA